MKYWRARTLGSSMYLRGNKFTSYDDILLESYVPYIYDNTIIIYASDIRTIRARARVRARVEDTRLTRLHMIGT